MGLHNTGFVESFIAKNYQEKKPVPTSAVDSDTIFIPIEDLPAGSWARQPGYVHLLKQIAPSSREEFDEIGDRWEAVLRREDTPRHVVYAKVAWGTDIKHTSRQWIERTMEDGARKTQVHRYSWSAPYQHFTDQSEVPTYNPITHTVEHTSTLLGTALLAHSVDQSALVQAFEQLRHANHSRFWRQESRYPAPWMAGALIPMLQSPYVMARLLGTPEFRALERRAQEIH